MFVFVCVSVCVCVSVFVPACLAGRPTVAWLHVCHMYMYACVMHVFVHEGACVNARKYIKHTDAHTHMHIHRQTTQTHAHIQICVHTCVNSLIDPMRCDAMYVCTCA